MEPTSFSFGAHHPIKGGCILLFNSELNFIHLELLVIICLILILIVKLLTRTAYLQRKKVKREEDKAILNTEQNEVLQKITGEQLQATNADIRNIPISQRWNYIEKEIDRTNNHFTKRLKARYPTLKEDAIRLCCLIRIGMDSLKIIQYLNISKDYLRKKRSLLAKSLKIKNYKRNLEQFIIEF